MRVHFGEIKIQATHYLLQTSRNGLVDERHKDAILLFVVHRHFVWTHPNVAAIDHWEFRQHPGPTYKAAEEQAVPGGNLPVGTMAFSTDFTLVAPGSSALFAVYALAPTGNEKRSNVIKIVRP